MKFALKVVAISALAATCGLALAQKGETGESVRSVS